MLDEAFALWADNGLSAGAGFCETLDLNGQQVRATTSRVRVQARQTFSFALACRLGWQPKRARELVAYGVDTLLEQCRRPDGLYGRHMAHAGGLADDTAELYDTAFAMLAFSKAAQIGVDTARQARVQAVAALEQHLQRPEPGNGYFETLPALPVRRQNPHMHLLEASLEAGFSDTGQSDTLRAKELVTLMQARFWDAPGAALRELFALDWRAYDGDHLEAGHHYEWVWLLGEYQRLTGDDVSGLAQKFYARALDLTGPRGEVFLEHSLGGAVQVPIQRFWSLTEAFKAHLSLYQQGDLQAGVRATNCFNRLWDMHIEPAVGGGWIDQYDGNDIATSEIIPASTGYHVYLALSELLTIVDRDLH